VIRVRIERFGLGQRKRANFETLFLISPPSSCSLSAQVSGLEYSLELYILIHCMSRSRAYSSTSCSTNSCFDLGLTFHRHLFLAPCLSSSRTISRYFAQFNPATNHGRDSGERIRFSQSRFKPIVTRNS